MLLMYLVTFWQSPTPGLGTVKLNKLGISYVLKAAHLEPRQSFTCDDYISDTAVTAELVVFL